MKKPAWVRVKVEHDLRRRFKKMARRRGQYPAEKIRVYMQRCVDETAEASKGGVEGPGRDG